MTKIIEPSEDPSGCNALIVDGELSATNPDGVNITAGRIDIEDIIKALSSPARREILGWLKSPESHFPEQLLPFENGVCAGKIFDRTDLSHSTVSAHLACLQRAGLVTSKKVGQWIFYKRNDEVIESFQKYLRESL